MDGQRMVVPTVSAFDSFVFWCLALLAIAGLAPCIIVPEWQQYKMASLIEQRQKARTIQMQAAVTAEARVLEAVSSDPAVMARLARRDLNLHGFDETAVVVPALSSIPEPVGDVSFVYEPPPLPALVQRINDRLPKYDYVGLFCDARTRITIIGMSTALMVAAMLLFAPRMKRAA